MKTWKKGSHLATDFFTAICGKCLDSHEILFVFLPKYMDIGLMPGHGLIKYSYTYLAGFMAVVKGSSSWKRHTQSDFQS